MNNKKNWHMRIDEAEAAGGFTEQDREDALNWPDCACSQQDLRIPRWTIEDSEVKNGSADPGAPIDNTLFRLGCQFLKDINGNNFKQSRRTLAAIEKRSAEILAEMGL